MYDCTFQYISCCYLSQSAHGFLSTKSVSIHLMLLFILTVILLSFLSTGFNTSHVVIYPLVLLLGVFLIIVSIHLMLLFISAPGIQRSVHRKFQYISCCYLSDSCTERQTRQMCFNTSHVVIYPVWHNETRDLKYLFQYISCCYLSKLVEI